MADSVAPSSVRSVALPAEHGGWAFLIEPLLLGLLVAGSLSGGLIALSAFGVFLLHQPLRIVVKDRRRGRVFGRTRLAQRFVLLYGALAAAGLAGALLTAQRADFWLPVLGALPAALLQLMLEARNQGRSLGAELGGALALSTSGPVIVLAGGGRPVLALAVSVLLVLRVLSSIPYVRVRLRLAKEQPVRRLPLIALHLVIAAVALALPLSGLSNGFAAAAGALLLARTVYGVGLAPASTPARVIGVQELIVGAAYVLLCAAALSAIP